LSKYENTYVITGDRHWQYCAEDPKTGLVELGCGPINDQHQYGGNPGYIIILILITKPFSLAADNKPANHGAGKTAAQGLEK
jgi:hypothetical protein